MSHGGWDGVVHGALAEREWPSEHMPTVVQSQSAATVRNDAPVCVLQMYDVMGDSRTVFVPEKVALAMALQLLTFVKQVTE